MFVIRLADGSYYNGHLGNNQVARTRSPAEAVQFIERWDAVKAAGTSQEFANAVIAPYWETIENIPTKTAV